MKKFGELALINGEWKMSSIPPHVVIRLKQLFPRIPKWQTGTFTFPADSTHCADLSWFISRYPMEMSDHNRLVLENGRENYEHNQARMEEILRPDYVPPSHVGLREGQEIRHYQEQASALFLARGSMICADPIGSGKTYVAGTSLLDPKTLPAVIVVQTHLQNQWQRKIESFTTLRVHKIKGTRPYTLPEADVYVYKYSQLLGWIDTFDDNYFRAVIYDEIQELRTGEYTGKGSAAKKLSNSTMYRLGLSATPIYNYGIEIYNIMQFIDPDILGTRDEFLREWCSSDKEVRDPDALGAYLREQHVMLRRTRAEIGRELPPVNTIVEYVDPDIDAIKSIEKLARQLSIKVTYGSYFERGQAGRELDLLVRHATGVSKAVGVANYAKLFLEANIPVIIAGWHRDVYDIWLRELKEYNPVMYTGSETASQKDESVRRFLSGESNAFIISLRSGVGLDDLQHRCSTVIIGELDWSPEVHQQVIGRPARDGQKEQVTAIYVLSDEGSDPPMVEVLGIKSSQASGIIDPGRQVDAKHSDKSRIQALAAQYLSKVNLEAIEA